MKSDILLHGRGNSKVNGFVRGSDETQEARNWIDADILVEVMRLMQEEREKEI